MIREVKKEKPTPPKRPSRLLRLLALVLTAALILSAVLLVVNRDKLNFDALKRWFTYRDLTRSDSGGGEPFSYQSGSSMTLALCGDDLLAVSQNGARLYSSGGTAYIEDTFPMDNPTCQVSGKAAVVYDAGGSALKVYKNRTLAFDLNDPSVTILSARLNQEGCLATVTRASGYKGVVSVYDGNFRLKMDLRLSSSYVLDALVSPDGHSLLVVTAAQENRLFNCSLSKYSLSDLNPQEPSPDAVWSLGNRLPLDLVWDEKGVRALTEYAALAADNGLKQTGEYDWSGRYLKRYSLLVDNGAVILTGKYRSGSQTTLEVMDRSGTLTPALSTAVPILDLSAAGRYIGVLTARELKIYTRELDLYATVEDTGNALRVVMRPDGTAFLATQDSAWLCLPTG